MKFKVGTLSTVIESEACMMILWKHECSRVFSDRFTIMDDKNWFDEEILCMIERELSPEYRNMALPNPSFVDFMRYSSKTQNADQLSYCM